MKPVSLLAVMSLVLAACGGGEFGGGFDPAATSPHTRGKMDDPGAPEPQPEPQPEPAASGCSTDRNFDVAAVREKIESCYDAGGGARPPYLDSNYQPAPQETPARLRDDGNGVGWSILEFFGWLGLEYIQGVASVRDRISGYLGCPSTARALLDEASRRINNMPGATRAQKVCAAQCVSSRIIDYEVNVAATFLGISVSVARGVGKCTEFAAIAKYLMNGSDGVSASFGFSPGHAFVRATFDGNTWNLEPQRDPSYNGGECIYYRQP